MALADTRNDQTVKNGALLCLGLLYDRLELALFLPFQLPNAAVEKKETPKPVAKEPAPAKRSKFAKPDAASVLELKQTPSGPRYAFLGEINILVLLTRSLDSLPARAQACRAAARVLRSLPLSADKTDALAELPHLIRQLISFLKQVCSEFVDLFVSITLSSQSDRALQRYAVASLHSLATRLALLPASASAHLQSSTKALADVLPQIKSMISADWLSELDLMLLLAASVSQALAGILCWCDYSCAHAAHHCAVSGSLPSSVKQDLLPAVIGHQLSYLVSLLLASFLQI